MLLIRVVLQPLLIVGLFMASVMVQAAVNEDKKANALFETFFDEWLVRSPMLQSEVGVKTDYDKWENLSDTFAAESHELTKKQLARLEQLNVSKLSAPIALSYELMHQQLSTEIDFYKWRLHDYPVNQMFGWHTTVPSILMNSHVVGNVKDAKDYIARLNAVGALMDQLIEGLELRASKGILAPKFVYPMVMEDSLNLIKGAPFDGGEPSTIFADFSKKVGSLKLDEKEKQVLLDKAKKALINVVKPAYLKLINELTLLEKKSDARVGAWKFPEGKAFYDAALKRTTTTDLTALQIHEIGLSEVKKVHQEMRDIMEKVKFKGNLHEFFTFMQNDKQFYFPNTDAGKAEYLHQVSDVIQQMKLRLNDLFITLPRADLIVKPVEAFREKSAGAAFYESPPSDGSRPGIYYVNLYDMKERASYKMASLAYHEALPGHHLQLSIATELGDIPRFRKHGFYTAYIEGWGLYAERLPKEVGFYQDPYSDFGRLEMELWRACRLVVDTGLHAKKWTKEQATNYLTDNTPSHQREAEKAVERYIVMPSQATAYKIGMLKIVELREKMKAKMKDKFDLRQFHDRVLRMGAVPLNILERELEKVE